MPRKAASEAGERVPLLCPSAYPEMAGSRVLGRVEGAANRPHEPHVTYLPDPVPVSRLRAAADGERATKSFRFVAPCVESQCTNWSGSRCQVTERMVRTFPPVVRELPACGVRPDCRWFAQEGAAACVRCPQVITDDARLIAAINERPAPPGSLLGERLSAALSRSAIRSVAQAFATKPAPAGGRDGSTGE